MVVFILGDVTTAAERRRSEWSCGHGEPRDTAADDDDSDDDDDADGSSEPRAADADAAATTPRRRFEAGKAARCCCAVVALLPPWRPLLLFPTWCAVGTATTAERPAAAAVGLRRNALTGATAAVVMADIVAALSLSL